MFIAIYLIQNKTNNDTFLSKNNIKKIIHWCYLYFFIVLFFIILLYLKCEI